MSLTEVGATAIFKVWMKKHLMLICRATFGEFKAKSRRLVVANDNSVLI